MRKILGMLAIMLAVFLLPLNIMAFPPLPDGLNIVPPDPSLPPTLVAFSGKSGKWEGRADSRDFFLIFEKINQEKATLWFSNGYGWDRIEAGVIKRGNKYKIWFVGRYGKNELSLRGEKYLDLYVSMGTVTFTRVP